MSQIYVVADFKLKEDQTRDQELIRNWNLLRVPLYSNVYRKIH